MSEYAKPFSGKDQREFARRRSVMNSLRAAKIRERRAARKAGDHGKDAAILLQGEKMGIPFGGVASAENLDQLVLSEMNMNEALDDKRATQRADMASRQSPRPQPEVIAGTGPDGNSTQETNINVAPEDTLFGLMMRKHPEETSRFVEDLMR
jgi:hypothetical protein